MNKLLEEYFIKTYPKIFRDMYGPVDKTCMHWGIQCDDGWFHILDILCSTIQNRIEQQISYSDAGYLFEGKTDPIPQVIAKQIKEKLGMLVFYYEGGDAVISEIVNTLTNISPHICEKCGIMNETVGRTTGWIRSLCPKCAKQFMSEEFRENEKFIQNKKKIELFKKVKQSKNRKK